MSAAGAPPSGFPAAVPGDLSGMRLGGSYLITEPLAQGGMGAVFLGVDEQTGEEVAIKVLRSDLARNEEAIARFRREVRALASLDSPHIVRSHDAGMVEGMPYLVMERLRGRGLDEVIASEDISPRRAIAIVMRMLQGLADAHAAGVIHRDLKPSNIWLTEDDGVKILDFGVAKMADVGKGPGEEEGKLTGTGAVLGSPAYMSPEQLISSKEADERADVWSVGVLLHELLTGSMLFGAETVGAIFANVIRMPIPSLREVLPGASPELEQILGRCLERDPELRIDSAEALAEALSVAHEADIRGERALVDPEAAEPLSKAGVAARGSSPEGTLSEVPTVMLPLTPTDGSVSPGGRRWIAGAFLVALVGLVGVVALFTSEDRAASTRSSAGTDEGTASVVEASAREPRAEPSPIGKEAAIPSATPATTSTAEPAASAPTHQNGSTPARRTEGPQQEPPSPSRPRIRPPNPSPTASPEPEDDLWETSRQ